VILILLILLIIYAVALHRLNRAIFRNMNLIQVRLDSLERRAHLAEGQTWIAVVKRKGSRKPERVELLASGESDAMRQLLVKGIGGNEILSLDPGLNVQPPRPAA